MPNGGNVSIEVHRDGDHVLAVVTDDGPGIEPTVLERIFDPFFTTKRSTGGTGLGLSVSLGIAESHGGTLTAASEPGHGAAFTLRLPIATGSRRMSRILVIDDEAGDPQARGRDPRDGRPRRRPAPRAPSGR